MSGAISGLSLIHIYLPLGDYHRLEGYLYPDTYEFTTPQNPLYVINKMLVRFDEQFTEDMRQEVADSGRTIHELSLIHILRWYLSMSLANSSSRKSW